MYVILFIAWYNYYYSAYPFLALMNACSRMVMFSVAKVRETPSISAINDIAGRM